MTTMAIVAAIRWSQRAAFSPALAPAIVRRWSAPGIAMPVSHEPGASATRNSRATSVASRNVLCHAARYSSAIPRTYSPAIAPAASVAAQTCRRRAARRCHSGAASADQSAANRASAAITGRDADTFAGIRDTSLSHAATWPRSGARAPAARRPAKSAAPRTA